MLAKGSPMTDENGKIVRDKEGKVIYEPYKIKVNNDNRQLLPGKSKS